MNLDGNSGHSLRGTFGLRRFIATLQKALDVLAITVMLV